MAAFAESPIRADATSARSKNSGTTVAAFAESPIRADATWEVRVNCGGEGIRLMELGALADWVLAKSPRGHVGQEKPRGPKCFFKAAANLASLDFLDLVGLALVGFGGGLALAGGLAL